MRDEMLRDGYTHDAGKWTSPYTGNVTTFQPAREEYLIVRNLGIARKTPMDWMREVRRLKDQVKALRDRIVQLEGTPSEQLPILTSKAATPFEIGMTFPWEDDQI